MMSYWLDKVLGANDDGNNLTKLAPLVIFFAIWLFGAIAKAVQKGKKGTDTEEESAEGQEKHESGFDGLAKKIREASQPKPPPPRRPEPMPTRKPAYPMQSTSEQEGPKLKVVKGMEKPGMGTPLPVDKPTLQKVESGLQRVDALTPENAKVSGKVEIIHHQYLSELAEQYSTADGLRKAILNYEILGPPLALRDYVYCGAVEAR